MSRVNSLVLLAFIFNLSVTSSIAMTDIMNDDQELKIKFDENRYQEKMKFSFMEHYQYL